MKQVANTLTGLKEDPVMLKILDRSKFLNDDTIDEILGWWSYDLLKRKAGLALDGIAYGLDLSTVLYEFAKRKMVVNFPKYSTMRGATKTEGQRVVSNENRHGPILRLGANKDMFSFNVLTNDMNVVGIDNVGAFRSFTIVGLTGEFDKTWEKIEFTPPEDIKDHFVSEGLGSTIYVKHFVHPSRRQQVYGQYYVKTKAAYQRLKEEYDYHSFQQKWFNQLGIRLDEVESGMQWPKSEVVGNTKKLDVPAFRTMLYIPDVLPHPVSQFVGRKKSQSQWDKLKTKKFDTPWDEWFVKREKLMDAFSDIPWFPNVEKDQEGLKFVTGRARYLRYNVLPTLNFLLRSTELAFCKYGRGATTSPMLPPWISVERSRDSWNQGFVLPPLNRKIEGLKSTAQKTEWDRLILSQDKVGQYGTALLKRTFKKRQVVNEDYNFTNPNWID